MRRLMSGAWCALALCAWACTANDDDSGDARPAPALDGALDAAADDARVEPDQAPPRPDAAPDAAPVDGCATACDRLGRCAIERCEIGGDDAAGVEAACATICAMTPQLASVINGAGDCATVVEFGRDRLPAQLGEACAEEVTPDPLPSDIPCPYPCMAGEQCLGGYCVRDDGTCVTDYHCRPDRETCDEGRCVTAQFAECRSSNACAEDQECRSFSADPFAPGICIHPCAADADCPFSESCQPALGSICYFEFCGPNTGNGTLYEDCGVGAFPGTCYPLSEGQARQGQPGYCIEAGTAAIGAPCDNGAEGRDEASAALRCVPGALCFGDADDPLDPSDPNDERGECVNLCDPRAPTTCTEDEFCLDFSQADDPNTALDETQHIGVCYRTDCDVFDDQCPDGQACRVLAVSSANGRCVPDGQVALGEPCATIDDCAGTSICGGNNRAEQVCIALCRPGVAGECPAEQFCFAGEAGQAIGFCIYPSEDFPAPDGGVEPGPDAGLDPDAGADADAGLDGGGR
ncbi:MAG: hypothetical protein H6705_21225 [Myxococcales bacterium]|nr:hypothetical protein [Myxococcales bacterium]